MLLLGTTAILSLFGREKEGRGGERRERERERERDRQTDRQRDRETDRETERQRQRDRERQREAERSRDRGLRHTHVHATTYMYNTLQEKLESKGYIQLSTYKGWYSVVDEAFYSPRQVQPCPEDATTMVCT